MISHTPEVIYISCPVRYVSPYISTITCLNSEDILTQVKNLNIIGLYWGFPQKWGKHDLLDLSICLYVCVYDLSSVCPAI